MPYNRRQTMLTLTAAGLCSLFGPLARAGDEVPETSSVRFVNAPALCIAPQYIAEKLLRGQGFDGYSHVPSQSGLAATEKILKDEADFSVDFGTAFIIPADKGSNLKVLAGLHTGCYELFAHEGVRTVLDLKGRKVGAGSNLGSDAHVFLSVMASHVGLDPVRDLDWVVSEEPPIDLFIQGKIDGFVSFGTETQKLRELNVGRVIVSGAQDRPWSQYFCCMIAASASYVEKNPVATKMVLRALFKGADLCISQPQSVAEELLALGYVDSVDKATSALKEISYNSWREYDPEDTLRFFALRMHESGVISSNPNDVVARIGDWRALKELKLELKT